MPYFSGLYDAGLSYGSAEFIIIGYLFFSILGSFFCFFVLLILDIIDFHDLLNCCEQQQVTKQLIYL